MPVISTRLASNTPSPAPITSATTSVADRLTPGPATVAMTAIAMPAIPYQTARLALSWPDRPPRERMKRTAAAM
jgi:hypothetical protein